MKLQELKQIIEEKVGWKNFKNLIQFKKNPKEFKDKTGLDLTHVNDFRSQGSGEDDGHTFIFAINNAHYAVEAYYSSFDGIDLNYEINNFYEVQPIQQTITVYEKIK